MEDKAVYKFADKTHTQSFAAVIYKWRQGEVTNKIKINMLLYTFRRKASVKYQWQIPTIRRKYKYWTKKGMSFKKCNILHTA